MADVARLRLLKPAQCHLPVSWYFDPKVFEAEKRLLFAAGANYVGHELMVPRVGDYHTLSSENDARVLVRNPGGVELLTNVCRHSEATTAEVDVTIVDKPGGAGAVRVRVGDPGPARGDTSGSRMGIVGMRERVTLHGGSLEVTPRDEGGFVVAAELTWDTSAATT